MKLIDIVETLQSEGHRVKYRIRTDGGLIITSIDGKKFKSLTEGNKTARSMVVGGELSFARSEQVHFNVKRYIKLNTQENYLKHKAKGDIDQDLMNQLRKVQKLWRTQNVKAGKISKKSLRAYLKYEGRERAMEYLQGRERYALGYAWEENVLFLCEKIGDLKKGLSAKSKLIGEIDSLIADIKAMMNDFKEEWIEPCHQILYKKGISRREKIRQIRATIGK